MILEVPSTAGANKELKDALNIAIVRLLGRSYGRCIKICCASPAAAAPADLISRYTTSLHLKGQGPPLICVLPLPRVRVARTLHLWVRITGKEHKDNSGVAWEL